MHKSEAEVLRVIKGKAEMKEKWCKGGWKGRGKSYYIIVLFLILFIQNYGWNFFFFSLGHCWAVFQQNVLFVSRRLGWFFSTFVDFFFEFYVGFVLKLCFYIHRFSLFRNLLETFCPKSCLKTISSKKKEVEDLSYEIKRGSEW